MAGPGGGVIRQAGTVREAAVIAQAKREWLPELKKIWMDAFGDSETEIDEFYRVFFREELAWCRMLEGRPVSVIYGLPALLWTDDGGRQKQRLVYLYAGATALGQRGKGYYAELLKKLCGECHAGRPVLCPVEDLVPYYEGLGFSLTLAGRELELPVKGRAAACLRLEALSAPEYKRRRDRTLGQAGYVEWDEGFLEYAVNQAVRGGGAAAGVIQNGCEHLILAVKVRSALRIVESTLSEELLAKHGGELLKKFDCKTLWLRQPPLMSAGPEWPERPYFSVALEE